MSLFLLFGGGTPTPPPPPPPLPPAETGWTADSAFVTADSGFFTADGGQAATPASVVGTPADILFRLQNLMPPGWFAPGATPIRDAMLTGIASAFAFIFSLFAYLKLQTRIATATDGFLDLIGLDYFGNALPRQSNQSDTSYRSRIQSALLPLRNTRQAIINALTLVTGRVPAVFEPDRPADTGGLNTGTLALGVAGGIGSQAYPYQAFVTAFRPPGTGIANVAGLGAPGALNVGTLECVGASAINGVTDNDIYAAVNAVRMAGTILWTRIES